MADLLRKNSDVFAKDDNDLGCAKIIKHDMDTGSESPIKQAPRRFPAEHEKEIETQIGDLLKHGLIQPGHGPWGSPIVLVKRRIAALGCALISVD